LKVEIEVRVELDYSRRKEIAEDAANYIARGESLQQVGVSSTNKIEICMARGDANIDIVKTVRTQGGGCWFGGQGTVTENDKVPPENGKSRSVEIPHYTRITCLGGAWKDDNAPGSVNFSLARRWSVLAAVALPTFGRHQNNTASSLLTTLLSLSPLNKLHIHISLSRFLPL
jgi:hypothetical protein